MKHRRDFLLAATAALFSDQAHTQVAAQPRTSDADDHQAWVAKVLTRLLALKPGQTRHRLLQTCKEEGGLSTGVQRTYVSKECAYFKVEVHFTAVGRPQHDATGRVTLAEDDRDIIASISRPFLQFSIMD